MLGIGMLLRGKVLAIPGVVSVMRLWWHVGMHMAVPHVALAMGLHPGVSMTIERRTMLLMGWSLGDGRLLALLMRMLRVGAIVRMLRVRITAGMLCTICRTRVRVIAMQPLSFMTSMLLVRFFHNK